MVSFFLGLGLRMELRKSSGEPVLSVMGFRNTAQNSNPCGNRAFVNMNAGHEIMYSANGGITTASNAPLNQQQVFLGEMKFFVR